jgi:nucleoside-diphosphate-sugar epimerase
MSKYLVTGGAGFIGSHIVETLLRDHHEVRVLDNLSTGRWENVEPFTKHIEWIQADLRDFDAVDGAVRGVDYVIHQAALASVSRSIDDPATTNQVNVQGTINVLEASKRHNVRKVVYASSSSVYGDSEALPKVEDMTPHPKSPYAISKLAAEWYCRTYSHIYGLPTVSLRYFNVFGPRQDPTSQYAAVVPIFISALIEKRAPTIFGDGEQSRDFTYVDNVVDANLAACESPNPGGEVYNVACGSRFTLNDLYERLKRIIGIEVDAEYGPPRAGDVRHSQASIRAIQGDLRYAVRVDFMQGLERTVHWYRENSPRPHDSI